MIRMIYVHDSEAMKLLNNGEPSSQNLSEVGCNKDDGAYGDIDQNRDRVEIMSRQETLLALKMKAPLSVTPQQHLEAFFRVFLTWKYLEVLVESLEERAIITKFDRTSVFTFCG